MLYAAARHTAIDCWEKRQKKGYFFMTGDEPAYSHLLPHEVKNLIESKHARRMLIEGNVIDGNLQCKENRPAPTGGNNRVGGTKEDQCSSL